MEGLVDQPLVPELLERPHDRLHVGEVHGLVVVLEVDPPGLTGDRLLPLTRIAQDRFSARGVEAFDAVLDYVGPPGDRKVLHGLHLGRQAVAVPAEAAVDPVATHGLVPGHDILHVAGQEVAVVGQPVGEGWTVVEDVLGLGWSGLNRRRERALVRPPGQRPFLHGGEVGPSYVRVGVVGRVWGVGRGWVLVGHDWCRLLVRPCRPGGGGSVQRSAAPRWRSSNLRTLPLAFSGRTSMISTRRGAL